MERLIKFRAWDGLRMTNSGIMFNTSTGCLEVPREGSFGSTLTEKSKYVLMQYTGLKDKNGVEIYEGDIIKLHQFIQMLGAKLGVVEGEQELIGSISIDEFGAYFNCTDKDDQLSQYLILFNLHEESLEIIGNIYKNENLLNQ